VQQVFFLRKPALAQRLRLLGVRVGSLVHWDAQAHKADGPPLPGARRPAGGSADPLSLPLF
jgi:DNA polymerase-4